MRTYLILAERARAFDADPRVQEALAIAGVPDLGRETTGPYSSATAERLLAEEFDADALAARRVGNELLDQLAVDHVLGAA
jgi:xylose isomerase